MRTSFSRVDEQSESNKRIELGDDWSEGSQARCCANRKREVGEMDRGELSEDLFLLCDEVIFFQRLRTKGRCKGL
jgi:hypothetical protein